MDISILKLTEAIALCSGSDEAVAYNFHDLFGTTGCLLSCEQRREVQSGLSTQTGFINSANGRARKAIIQSQQHKIEQYFSLAKLRASIDNGCGSCNAFQKLLQIVFFVPSQDPTRNDTALYHISYYFVLRKKVTVNGVTDIQHTRLFRPSGMT